MHLFFFLGSVFFFGSGSFTFRRTTGLVMHSFPFFFIGWTEGFLYHFITFGHTPNSHSILIHEDLYIFCNYLGFVHMNSKT